MTEEGAAQLPGVSRMSRGGAVRRAGRRPGPGRALSSSARGSSPCRAAGGLSGLGDLLTPGGAGWQPGSSTLLGAEAVLVLQEGGNKQSAREHSTASDGAHASPWHQPAE